MAERTPDPSATTLDEDTRKKMAIVRDVYAGTLRMREKSTTYLRKFPREDDTAYAERLAEAVLFNATKRTVGGLVGMVMRKDIALADDVPEQLKRDTENVDLAGRHLDVYARDLLTDAILDGHDYVFVDWSAPAGAVPTLADERQAGARPYWALIRKEDMLGVRAEWINGRPVLQQVRWRETVSEPVDRFADEKVEQVRVYEMRGGVVHWETWRMSTDKENRGQWVIFDQGMLEGKMDEIPLVVCYANRSGFNTSEPPLLDLALENVRHYQLRSDRDNNLHVASTPIPVFIGLDEDDTIVASVSQGIKLPVDGDAKYLECTGKSLDYSKDELSEIERRMAMLGLSLLHSDTRAAETATSKQIDKSESDSQLSAMARGLEDALEDALRLHAKWYGLPSGGSVTVNTDFVALTMDAQTITALSALVAQGQLDIGTLWDILRRGEVLPDSFDAEMERAKVDGVLMAMQQPRPAVEPQQENEAA